MAAASTRALAAAGFGSSGTGHGGEDNGPSYYGRTASVLGATLALAWSPLGGGPPEMSPSPSNSAPTAPPNLETAPRP
jgi:hypothetical protein